MIYSQKATSGNNDQKYSSNPSENIQLLQCISMKPGIVVELHLPISY
jgi:hypothetical protein